MKMTNRKEQALFYLKKGWSVIPVGKNKKPLFAWKEYTTRKPTKKEITKWWDENPLAGVAIVTGAISNLTVIDVEKGGLHDYLPETLISKTGGGGYHYYYQYCKELKNSVRIRDLTDIRNNGGYVIAPPSRHASKRKYKWHKKMAPKVFPKHLFFTETTKQKKEHKSEEWEELLKGVGKGERNSAAAQVAGRYLVKVKYRDWDEIAWPMLQTWNELNKPPLPETELRATFDSIASRVDYKQEDTEKEVLDIEALIGEHRERITARKKGDLQSVSSGIIAIDESLNGGFKDGELVLIGARPSVGKTSFALTLALNAAATGKNVLFFSIEMASIEIFERLLAFVTNIPCSSIIQGQVEDSVMEKAYKKVSNLPLHIAELTTATTKEVADIVKARLLENEVDLVVVDYLQFLGDKPNAQSQAVRVGTISRNLKMIARSFNIPVIAPTQLNRRPEDRKDRRPVLSDLRDSGNLEQDADIVMLLHRDIMGDSKNQATLYIAKNRKGTTGEIPLEFDIDTTLFT